MFSKVVLFGLCMKLIPIVYMVFAEVVKAKVNDGEVDFEEGKAIFQKMADALKDEFMGKIK